MDRVAIVTGAAQGLGAAYAVGLARKGFRVAALDLRPLDGVMESIGADRCLGIRVDMTEERQVRDAVAEVDRRLGRIDILVNNVGGFPRLSFLETTSERWHQLLRLNLDSVFYACSASVPVMMRGRYGRIVNIASGTVFKGSPGHSAYVAAKAGVIGLTRVLATELGEAGITVNCVAPGLTATEGAEAYTAGFQGEAANIARRSIHRREVPEDVVGAVLFFASEDAGFVTGQTLVVDGGNVKH